MERYNWQQPVCPDFRYSLAGVEDKVLIFSEKAGRVSGILQVLPEDNRQDLIIDILLTEAIKTSEIEGEFPDRKNVLSSIRKNLGLHTTPPTYKG
jgi:Fic family protein